MKWPPHIQHAVRKLLESDEDSPDLIELARLCGCSAGYLSRGFKRHTGKSIREFRRNLRIGRAMSILKKKPDTPLSQIALEIGYRSHSHFTHAFRQETGMTPTRFLSGL